MRCDPVRRKGLSGPARRLRLPVLPRWNRLAQQAVLAKTSASDKPSSRRCITCVNACVATREMSGGSSPASQSASASNNGGMSPRSARPTSSMSGSSEATRVSHERRISFCAVAGRSERRRPLGPPVHTPAERRGRSGRAGARLAQPRWDTMSRPSNCAPRRPSPWMSVHARRCRPGSRGCGEAVPRGLALDVCRRQRWRRRHPEVASVSKTAEGCRTVIVDGTGAAYLPDARGGRLIVVRPAR